MCEFPRIAYVRAFFEHAGHAIESMQGNQEPTAKSIQPGKWKHTYRAGSKDNRRAAFSPETLLPPCPHCLFPELKTVSERLNILLAVRIVVYRSHTAASPHELVDKRDHVYSTVYFL